MLGVHFVLVLSPLGKFEGGSGRGGRQKRENKLGTGLHNAQIPQR